MRLLKRKDRLGARSVRCTALRQLLKIEHLQVGGEDALAPEVGYDAADAQEGSQREL